MAAIPRASHDHVGPSCIPGLPPGSKGMVVEPVTIQMTFLKSVGELLAAARYQAHDCGLWPILGSIR